MSGGMGRDMFRGAFAPSSKDRGFVLGQSRFQLVRESALGGAETNPAPFCPNGHAFTGERFQYLPWLGHEVTSWPCCPAFGPDRQVALIVRPLRCLVWQPAFSHPCPSACRHSNATLPAPGTPSVLERSDDRKTELTEAAFPVSSAAGSSVRRRLANPSRDQRAPSRDRADWRGRIRAPQRRLQKCARTASRGVPPAGRRQTAALRRSLWTPGWQHGSAVQLHCKTPRTKAGP